MNVKHDIEQKLRVLAPLHLVVENESDRHAVPPNSETHFKVTLVAACFLGVSAVKRHQQVYQLLQAELTGGVHALALHLYAPDEWQGQAPNSPNCMSSAQ